MSIFRLVLRRLLVARKENLTGVSTGLTGRLENLDPTGFHLWAKDVLEDSTSVGGILIGRGGGGRFCPLPPPTPMTR